MVWLGRVHVMVGVPLQSKNNRVGKQRIGVPRMPSPNLLKPPIRKPAPHQPIVLDVIDHFQHEDAAHCLA